MWLVQRCKPKVKVYNGEKVSDYMSLDYMGSAEFEFGAIPKSIRRLAGKPNLTIARLPYTNHKHHNFNIMVLADNKDMPAAFQAIEDYLGGKTRLKEWTRFKDRVNESESYDPEFAETFWWVVDEGHSDNDPNVLNFCFSLDPEQCRCFKLALEKSLQVMNAKKGGD